MKKRIAVIVIVSLMALCLFGCGGSSSGSSSSSSEPLDLTGTWEQTNATGETTMEAVISGDTITINWVSNGGDTKSLYWAGSYIAPTEAADTYTWDSTNDHSQTDSALLASGDDTKTFNYENGVLSYSASALGSTTTVKMERQ